jgi:RNA-directed DNA polymerase
MNGREKSDPAIVAAKLPNKDGRPSAEAAEPRAGAEGNAGRRSTLRAQDRDGVAQGLDRIRLAARERKEERFTSLLHHVSVDHLRAAFYAVRRDAAPGVDGVTWQDYEAGLDARLADLHDRVHRGGPYHPFPSRRRYIPSRMDGRDRSRSPLLKTRSSRGRRRRC